MICEDKKKVEKIDEMNTILVPTNNLNSNLSFSLLSFSLVCP